MTETIDVERIMSDIRDEIKRSGRDKEQLSFEDPERLAASKGASSDLKTAVDYISCNYEVQPYEPLGGNFIVVFVKRVIRKLTGFFLLPIVRQQNTLNYYYYKISENVADMKDGNEELKERIELLEKRVSKLEEGR